MQGDRAGVVSSLRTNQTSHGHSHGRQVACFKLADEYVPDWQDIEGRLITKYTLQFTAKGSPEKAVAYLTLFGTLHICMRFELILSKKEAGPWWDEQYCLAGERISVTQAAADAMPWTMV